MSIRAICASFSSLTPLSKSSWCQNGSPNQTETSHAITSDIRLRTWSLGKPAILKTNDAPLFPCSPFRPFPIFLPWSPWPIDAVRVSGMLFRHRGVRWWNEECRPWPPLVVVTNASLRSGRYDRLSSCPNGNGHRSSSTPPRHLNCGPQPVGERIAVPRLSHLFLLMAAPVTHHHLLPSCHSHDSVYLVL
jgi:hypothetical protein